MNDVYLLFQKCFPQFQVPLNDFQELLPMKKCMIHKKINNNVCIGIIVWEKNKIRLLLVDPEFYEQGIGQELLTYSESNIMDAGYDTVILGGKDSKLFLGANVTKEEWDRQSSDYFVKRGYVADNGCLEMKLILDDYFYPKEISPFPENICFQYYSGGQEKLLNAVAKVDKAWVKYYKENHSVYVAMDGDEIAAFCILIFDDKTLLCKPEIKIGSIGCVGTVPKKRKQGIGLAMVAKATLELKKHGCDISWIHYTYLDWWYGKLGYETYLRFWFGYKRLTKVMNMSETSDGNTL